MIVAAIVLFLIAALGGVVMAVKLFRGQPVPSLLAAGHGAFAAGGLVVLVIAVLQSLGGELATAALIILLVAALGGFFLLSFHVRGKPHPHPVVMIHALVAVIGVLTLIAVAVGGGAH